MKWQFEDDARMGGECEESSAMRNPLLKSNIAASIDVLVDYLVENNVEDIRDLILGEVEKRILLRVLERTGGNKRQAAKLLGMNRNTFQRKMLKLAKACQDAQTGPGSLARR